MKQFFLSILLTAFVAVSAHGQAMVVKVQEADGSPSIPSVTKIVLPNGSLTKSGQTATISFTASGAFAVPIVITSNSAACFEVGPNGSTNPTFRVVCNVASAVTGVSVTGRAAAAGADLTVISSGTDESLMVVAKGAGAVYFPATGGAGSPVVIGPTTSALSATFVVLPDNGATNALVDVARVGVNSTGTAAAGFGPRLTFAAESSTTNDQVMARLSAVWTTATHASRSADLVVETVSAATVAERLRITSDGRLYGTALHNNAGAVTGTTNQYLASGTYTPTLTNVTNVAASTPYACQWMRVGNVVTVSGQVDIDATLAASAATELGISLPIASNFAAAEQLGGDAISDSVASLSARIRADATNDRAAVVFKAISLTNDTYSFTFSYLIL